MLKFCKKPAFFAWITVVFCTRNYLYRLFIPCPLSGKRKRSVARLHLFTFIRTHESH